MTAATGQGQPRHLYFSALGHACASQARYEEALAHYDLALGAKPDHVVSHYNKGVIHQERGEVEAAIASYKRALELKPDYAEAHNNLGQLYERLGKSALAVGHYEQARGLRPDLPEAAINLGNVHAALKDYPGAEKYYQEALALRPGWVDVHANLANLYALEGRLAEAIRSGEAALHLNPDHAEAHNNLGNALQSRGELRQAIAHYRRALRLKPQLVQAHSNLLLSLQAGDDISPPELFEEHQRFGFLHRAEKSAPCRKRAGAGKDGRKVRLGYVSPDFRSHPVAYFVENILRNHDHHGFEVYCYSEVSCPDGTTARLKGLVDRWREIKGLSDADAARLIEEDGIDILVDLAGHTAGNRLLLFARKPAPVQVTYLGYPGTTGLTAMDYRITDSFADPVGISEQFHTERLVRLPETFLLYNPPACAREISPPPVSRTGRITFGSFNNLKKLSPSVVALWAEILRNVPGSKLILKARALSDGETREHLAERFAQQGMGPDRLELSGFLNPEDHLALYNRIDIALDTFPYNGTTTTFEALWMGVPVITLEGERHAGRVGVSILSNLGMQECIAQSPAAYVARACELAGDPARLAKIRGELRERMLASPLLDGRKFTARLETAYRALWQEHGEAGPRPASAQDAGSFAIKIRGGVRVCLPATVNLLTPYVLLEQEDWFEDEIRFVRRLIGPGMRVVDIGANYGLYSLTMAKGIGPGGHLWAFEPARSTAGYLGESVRINQFRNTEIIEAALSNKNGQARLALYPNSEMNTISEGGGETGASESVETLRIDDCAARLGLKDLDFLKIDAEGQEENIIEGAAGFLSAESPLIMFELRHGDQVNSGLIARFAGLGYETYRLVPGLDILAPVDSPAALDPLFQLNLFCCKRDRAALLAKNGVLALRGQEAVPVAAAGFWPASLGALPCFAALTPYWLKVCGDGYREPGWEGYRRALEFYGSAKDGRLPAMARYAALEMALAETMAAVDRSPNLSRLLTLVRLQAEAGQRKASLETMQRILSLINSPVEYGLPEPFLPVLEKYEAMVPGAQMESWCLAALLEYSILREGFSTYFTGERTLEKMELFRTMGFPSAEVERRYRLVRMRQGLKTSALPALLQRGAEDNLNPELWARLR